MILGFDAEVVTVLALTLVVGALVQGLVGLGLGLVAAPVAALVAPELVPAMLLWLGMAMATVTLTHEHDAIDWRGLAWVVPSRVPGTVAGVLLVGWFSTEQLGVAIGVMVLVSVALTVHTIEVSVRPSTLVLAGFLSGVTATATAIGGPPVALVFQHRPPAQIRSTLAVIFLAGSAFSLLGLVVGGQTDLTALLMALVLVPCVGVGFGLSRVLHRVVPARHLRTGVLVVCAASALVLLGRSLV